MRKVISLVVVLALTVGLIGCSSNDNEQALEQVKSEVRENSQNQHTSENAEVKPQNEVERGERTPEQTNNAEGKKEEGARENGSGKGTKRGASQEKIEEIIKQLDKKVEDGELTTEERDKLVEEIKNGNLRNVKEVLGNQ